MKKKTWKSRIKSACTAAGTYRPFFDPVIDTLAGILEKRDAAEESYQRSGGNAMIRHTNKAGAVNVELNPALRLVNDLNRDALTYWRDLGLTPAGLRKIDEAEMRPQKRNGLADILADFGE